MSPGVVLVGIGLLLTIAGSLGVAYAVFRSTATTKTLEIYKSEAEALGQRANRLEAEVKRLEREAAQEREKQAATAAALDVLRQGITGEVAVRELAAVIAREEAARRDEHRSQIEKVDRIEAKLERLVSGAS